MSGDSFQDLSLQLREFIKDNETKLFQFLSYLLFGSNEVENLTVQIFREFGDKFRKNFKNNDEWEKTNLRIQLYTIAWKWAVRAQGDIEYTWALGRDTRPLKQLDTDLLAETKLRGQETERLDNILLRLARIELDYRTPMVLKDVLGFEDEEILRILSLRWGVYRHRLHRGRLAFRELLRGKQYKDKEGAVGATPQITRV